MYKTPMRLPPDLPIMAQPSSEPLKDTHDGLRGFEICDPDGYILFFGRPIADAPSTSPA